jgi:hypothetical protein
VTEQHPYPDGPPKVKPTEDEAASSDTKDPVEESDPLEELGSPDPDDGQQPDGSPRTSPTD